MSEKLTKSLEEIDALADEVLAKSVEASKEADEEKVEKSIVVEEDGKGEIEKGIKPDEVSKDAEGSEDSEDEDGDKEKGDDKEVVEKSFAEELTENEVLAKSLEVSEFLTEFTRVNGNVIDVLRSDINKSLDASTHTATILAKSFGAIMKSQEGLTNLVKSQATQLTEQSAIIKSLQERVDGVERQPAQRKAVVTTFEKSFDHSAGLANAGEEKELSKSEKLTKLTDMAMNSQNGVTINDVVSYESTGQLRPELETILKG